MALVSLSNLRVDLVNATFPRLTALIRVLDVLHTACRYLVFQGKPAGRLALFRYLQSWFIEDVWPYLTRTKQSFWSKRVCLMRFRIPAWRQLYVFAVEFCYKGHVRGS